MRYTIRTLPFAGTLRRVTRGCRDECDVGGDEYDVGRFASNNIRSFIAACLFVSGFSTMGEG
jgi:hypothetical protein